jgi:hypothetical protein
MLDPVPNPVPEPKCITVPVPLGKTFVPAFSVLQHCQEQGSNPSWHRFGFDRKTSDHSKKLKTKVALAFQGNFLEIFMFKKDRQPCSCL